jgi:hypothetical protein
MDPRVYRAMATPIVGHMDPWFKGCMEDTQVLMRQIFQTENRITMPLSASGSGGIEASLVNTLEEGDEAIICVNGWFSDRMAEIAGRTPATVTRVESPYGTTVDPEEVRKAGKGRKIKIIGLAQGETSSGVLTQLAAFREVADELGALLIVDTVASLAAVPLHIDNERVDICFSGTQKAISAPPGMSPITVSPKAEEVFRNRKTKVQSWYFDLTTAMNYWGKDRLYHHTPPISLQRQGGDHHGRRDDLDATDHACGRGGAARRVVSVDLGLRGRRIGAPGPERWRHRDHHRRRIHLDDHRLGGKLSDRRVLPHDPRLRRRRLGAPELHPRRRLLHLRSRDHVEHPRRHRRQVGGGGLPVPLDL